MVLINCLEFFLSYIYILRVPYRTQIFVLKPIAKLTFFVKADSPKAWLQGHVDSRTRFFDLRAISNFRLLSQIRKINEEIAFQNLRGFWFHVCFLVERVSDQTRFAEARDSPVLVLFSSSLASFFSFLVPNYTLTVKKWR